MMLTIDEDLWGELSSGEQESGIRWRRIHPESDQDLRLAFDTVTSTRRLLYVRDWSEDQAPLVPESTRSIGVSSRRGPAGKETVSVMLMDPSLADIFNVLTADVASAVAEADGPAFGIVALNSRLGRWQKLLARVKLQGLSAAECRGIFGELHVLEEFLSPLMEASLALQTWTGPLAANQDFQGNRWAIEVKATAAKQPQGFTVNNERELDDTGVDYLALCHISLDERRGGTGVTLNEKIDRLRGAFADSIGDLNLFNGLLIRLGYFEEHREKYDPTSYTLRHQLFFEVTGAFPRIVENDLTSGVGAVVYQVDLVACEAFRAAAGDVESRMFSNGETDD